MQVSFLRINKDHYTPESDKDAKKLNSVSSDGELVAVVVKNIAQRSIKQNGLFWACCQLVADNADDNSWNTKRKVANQCLLNQQLIKSYTEYIHPVTKEKLIHFELQSISFENMPHLEACAFFDKAFDFMAEKLQITRDQLEAEAKARMKGRGVL